MSASSVSTDYYEYDTTSSNQQATSIDPAINPIAYWYTENYPGMTDEEALAAEQGFLKTFDSITNQILDSYKHMFDSLNPEKNPDLEQ